MTEKLERLAAAGIRLLPAYEITSYYVLERDGIVALVGRAGDSFGEIGSPGLLTESGFAALVWRDENAFFVSKNFEQPASQEQVELVRRFASDLEAAFR